MKNNTYKFCTVDSVSAHKYIKNKQVISIAKSDLKGIVMFSVVLHDLCQALVI